MDTNTAHARITTAVRSDARTGVEWAALLGIGPQSLSDRLRTRTAWTLADAVTIAATLCVSVDALVGNDDLPLGYTLPALPHAGERDALALRRLEAERGTR